MSDDFDDHKARAAGWFRALRDEIVAAFEGLEDTQCGPTARNVAGRFEVTPDDAGRWRRRADERHARRAGVREGRRQRQRGSWRAGRARAKGDGRARRAGDGGRSAVLGHRASALSRIMQNPHAPAVHMNTRMFWTPARLVVRRRVRPQPLHRICRGHRAFPRHAASRPAMRHAPDYYPRFKAWADEYFFVPHRGRARGVGGIFYDDLNTGDWEADFAFTQDVGRAFLPAYRAAGRGAQGPALDRGRRRTRS